MRSWPRNPKNDAFHHSSIELGRELEVLLKEPVIVCFNEFCDPDVPAAFAEAAARGAVEIRVITPMMIRGGSHSDREIPDLIASEKTKYPHIRFRYVWPFQPAQVAGFLSARLVEEPQAVE
jgi:sirohydrochlorin ferrochelatase